MLDYVPMFLKNKELFIEMEDEELGRFVKALIYYIDTEEIFISKGDPLFYAFKFYLEKIDFAADRAEERSKKAKENANARWSKQDHGEQAEVNANDYNHTLTDANACQRMQENANASKPMLTNATACKPTLTHANACNPMQTDANDANQDHTKTNTNTNVCCTADTATEKISEKSNDNNTDITNNKRNQSREQSREQKKKYGKNKNITLSDSELDKLKATYPDHWKRYIDELSDYIKGRVCRDPLSTLIDWGKRDFKQAKPKISEVVDRSFDYSELDTFDFTNDSSNDFTAEERCIS